MRETRARGKFLGLSQTSQFCNAAIIFHIGPRGKRILMLMAVGNWALDSDIGPIANEGCRRVARIASAAAMNPTVAAQESVRHSCYQPIGVGCFGSVGKRRRKSTARDAASRRHDYPSTFSETSFFARDLLPTGRFPVQHR